ncbi:hypothetical protein K4G60_g4926, partial [Candida parapsilosis]
SCTPKNLAVSAVFRYGKVELELSRLRFELRVQ